MPEIDSSARPPQFQPRAIERQERPRVKSIELHVFDGADSCAFDSSAFPLSALRSSMAEYYRAAIPQSAATRRQDLILSLGDMPIAALCGTWTESEGHSSFEYFGSHARLELRSDIDSQILDGRLQKQIVKRLTDQFRNSAASIEFEQDRNHSMVFPGLFERSISHSVYFEASIDPSLGPKHIDSSMASGHRESVKKGLEKLQDVEVHYGSMSPDLIDQVRQLHLDMAGKVTRSLESWEKMRESVISRQALMVTAKQNQRLIGATFSWFGSAAALYGTGVYDRYSFSETPISHPLIRKSLHFLGKEGCNRYIVGQGFDFSSDSKLRNLAAFKRGFADSITLVHKLNLRDP